MIQSFFRSVGYYALVALIIFGAWVFIIKPGLADVAASAPLPSGGVSARSIRSNAAEIVAAKAALPTLEVKGRAAKTGYSRDQFGAAWADIDKNGCDQRNDILKRDLTNVKFKDGTKNCVFASGTLVDPYTGTTINFVREATSMSQQIDIDHVVALGDVWVKNGQSWTAEKRRQVANDPLNLQSASASANRAKGDADAATWLPPNKEYRCTYVSKQIIVKKKYGISVTSAEKNAMQKVLAGC